MVFSRFQILFSSQVFDGELQKRRFFLCDTFNGIDPELMDGSPVSLDEHRKVGLHDFVTKRFAEFDNVTIVCGSVPASLSEIKFEVFPFCILMNSYQAEIGALEYLWDFIPTGGVIVLDDLGWLNIESRCNMSYLGLRNEIVMCLNCQRSHHFEESTKQTMACLK